MTREEYLEFCMICTKRKMDMGKGIVCSLTNEHANFDTNCKDFVKDPLAELEHLEKKLRNTGDHKSGHAYDFKKNKQQGVFVILLGVVLLILTTVLAKITGVYIVSVGVLFYGIYQYRRGVEQEKIMKEHLDKRK